MLSLFPCSRMLCFSSCGLSCAECWIIGHAFYVTQGLLQASNRFPVLTELEIDGMSTNCSRMLRSLYNALKKGKLPHLLSLTFTCRAVGDNEAWKQHALANEVRRQSHSLIFAPAQQCLTVLSSTYVLMGFRLRDFGPGCGLSSRGPQRRRIRR
jgi:hypothetical protein